MSIVQYAICYTGNIRTPVLDTILEVYAPKHSNLLSKWVTKGFEAV